MHCWPSIPPGALDMIYGNFGTAAAPNLFIQKLTDPPNADLPDFNVDGPILGLFSRNVVAANVAWTESSVGISGRDFATGNIIQTLADGGSLRVLRIGECHATTVARCGTGASSVCVGGFRVRSPLGRQVCHGPESAIAAKSIS